MVFVGWHIGPNCEPRNACELFHLKRERMPHESTWSRVLGYGVEPSEVEQIVGQFFAQAVRASRRPRGSIHFGFRSQTSLVGSLLDVASQLL